MESILTDRADAVEERQQTIGPQICAGLVRLIKAGRVFSADHDQTLQVAREFAQWLNATMEELEQQRLAIQMTDHNMFLDGRLIRLDERHHERVESIRALLLSVYVNQLIIRTGVTAGELIQFVVRLGEVRNEPQGRLNGFALPHLRLDFVDPDDEDEHVEQDERRELIELYAGMLVRCREYFERFRRGKSPSTKDVKRIVQRIADELAGRSHVFVGLINMKLVSGQDFVHAANCGIYSMLLAHAVGLGRVEIVRCGMTAVAQDVDKISQGEADEHDLQLQVGDATHFKTNMASVVALATTGTHDVLSALRLVTNYERGFPYNRPLPSTWYRDELQPHLLSRIVEIARDYDLLTTGYEDREPMTPDMALQALMEKTGAHYDPSLMKLFINVLGIYPVGSVVRMSDGRDALVIKSPHIEKGKQASGATRPTVRLLDGSDEVVDLADPRHRALRIERILNDREIDKRPSAFLLF